MRVSSKIFHQKFRAIRVNARLRRYGSFKKLSILSQLTWAIFWRLNILKIILQKSILFSKPRNIRKNMKKFFEKNFLWKFFVKKRFYSSRLLKIIFRKKKASKIVQCQLIYDYFWPTSNAHKSEIYYPNETFNNYKWYYLSRSFTWNIMRSNFISDLGDIAISKNC